MTVLRGVVFGFVMFALFQCAVNGLICNRCKERNEIKACDAGWLAVLFLTSSTHPLVNCNHPIPPQIPLERNSPGAGLEVEPNGTCSALGGRRIAPTFHAPRLPRAETAASWAQPTHPHRDASRTNFPSAARRHGNEEIKGWIYLSRCALMRTRMATGID